MPFRIYEIRKGGEYTLINAQNPSVYYVYSEIGKLFLFIHTEKEQEYSLKFDDAFMISNHTYKINKDMVMIEFDGVKHYNQWGLDENHLAFPSYVLGAMFGKNEKIYSIKLDYDAENNQIFLGDYHEQTDRQTEVFPWDYNDGLWETEEYPVIGITRIRPFNSNRIISTMNVKLKSNKIHSIEYYLTRPVSVEQSVADIFVEDGYIAMMSKDYIILPNGIIFNDSPYLKRFDQLIELIIECHPEELSRIGCILRNNILAALNCSTQTQLEYVCDESRSYVFSWDGTTEKSEHQMLIDEISKMDISALREIMKKSK